MSDTMIEMARKEIHRLRQELEANPTYRKLRAVEKFIAAYEAAEKGGPVPGENIQSETPSKNAVSKKALIERHAVEYLKKINRRSTSGPFVKYMESVGIKIGGKKPSATMASYLSNCSMLNSRPDMGGYGLAEWGDGVPVDFSSPDLLSLKKEEATH